jgi:cysteinyl-tRNA synthetase
MKIFNSLTKKEEEFEPINPPKVGMYTCGPTVYHYPTIGNWRTYTTSDLMFRLLRYLGFEVSYVMNLTDVGHLTGDNEGDADTGEDRMEKAARREGKSAWEVADFYTKDFILGFEKLNLIKPMVFAKATEHIQEQIELVKEIEEKGFAYQIDDGIYFDVAAYERAGNTYGELSTLDQIKEGARIEANPQKKDPRDFALWKFSPKGVRRDMEWESPWGMGFPGWHIECSAMGMKYLGKQFDIHLGGEDLRSTHHPNEIAQSEAGTGKKPFVKYWMHSAFITIDGGRMGKSLGNAFTLQDIEAKGFNLMDLRYLYLTGHYRKQLNFTWEALEAAKVARMRLVNLLSSYKESTERTDLKETKLEKIDDFNQEFKNAIENDLNMPEALAVIWKVVKSNISDYDKYDLIIGFDEVLGLDLVNSLTKVEVVPKEVESLLYQREEARKAKDWVKADELRNKIEEMGWGIEDSEKGVRVVKNNPVLRRD